jgi:hypothetical protein
VGTAGTEREYLQGDLVLGWCRQLEGSIGRVHMLGNQKRKQESHAQRCVQLDGYACSGSNRGWSTRPLSSRRYDRCIRVDCIAGWVEKYQGKPLLTNQGNSIN